MQFAGVEKHARGSVQCKLSVGLGMGVFRTNVEEAGAGNRGIEDR